jgi:acetyl-CoA carboxylase biotin carboxyl carrier protein
MNAEELKTFLHAMKETDIEELRLEAGETKVFFRKSDVVAVVPPPLPRKVAPVEKQLLPVKSPMVGTFYHSTSADHPPFVIEGSQIEPGQKVGIIEAMKINKDVVANIRGRIVKVAVKNGQSVEYGQELFLIDSDAEAAGAKK